MKNICAASFTRYLLGTLLFLGVASTTSAQSLKPGFDKGEYIELLKVSALFGDSAYVANFPKPQRFRLVYQSPVVGLDNRWNLWTDNGGTAVINLRGTTTNSVSWLANLYAAMVPASGELQLSDTEKFSYHLADNPRAAVHVGWLVSTAFLARDLLPKIDSSYRKGVKNILIMGHSQGGAIAFLLTSHLYDLQRQGKLPADLRFKTYCSAGPKPGNLYYAYAYEATTQGGWACNVLNSADWVPEVPFSVQTVNDLNLTNPFAGANQLIKKQPFFKRLVLRKVYSDLSKPSLKAQKNYQKYLGKIASNTVKKSLTGYVPPAYYNSNHYVRTGNTIVLLADSAYYRLYPDSREKVFTHHFHQAYLYLTEHSLTQSGESIKPQPTVPLTGTWELDYLATPGADLAALYPNRKPTITFDLLANRIAGSTGCNSFSGPLSMTGSSFRFPETAVMTRMMCQGGGEEAFLTAIKKANRFAITNNVLTLLTDDVAVMRFVKK